MQILFPLRGERISNRIDFSREFSPLLFFFLLECVFGDIGSWSKKMSVVLIFIS